MTEPWDRQWGPEFDWSKLPRIAPTFPALLAHFRTVYAARDVMVFDDRHLTYGELEARSALLARQLVAAGIGKGSRVGLLLQSDETFLITWMAVTRIGAVAVTLPSLSTAAEIHRISVHADLQMLFCARHYLHHDYAERIGAAFPGIAGSKIPYRLADTPALRAVWFWGGPTPDWSRAVDLEQATDADAALLAAIEAEVHSSDPAGIIYTSGSTAEPKGVIHSHGSFVRQGMKLAMTFQYGNDERVYASMPFFWVGGLVSTAMCVMTLGATLLASARTGAGLLDFLEQERTTSVLAWPHIMRGLAADPSFAGRNFSSMRNGLFYEALPPRARPADPGLMPGPLGMTEVCAVYTVLQRNLSEEQRGSVGPLMPGLEAQLVDPDNGCVIASWPEGATDVDSGGKAGVMYLRSDVMMLGMVKREPADVFTRDGWYVSGDICSFRAGHVHYHGRADDMIKAAGANVSPGEVEVALLQIPGVAAANVIGVPDIKRGMVIGAAVVLEPGSTLDRESISRQVAVSLASYKRPRIIAIVEAAELPKLPSSKVDRRALRQLLQHVSERPPT
jgi:acyl-CoA synthetase (AMP-forming)/AMP-acid ligase II